MINTRWTFAATLAMFVCSVGCGDETTNKPSPDTTTPASGSPMASVSGTPLASASASSATPEASASSSAAASSAAASSAAASASSSAATSATAATPKPTAKPPTPKPAPTPKLLPTPPPATTIAKTVQPPRPTPAPKPSKVVKLDAAKAGSADEIADKIDLIYKPVDRFRARFEQKYVAKVAGKTKKSSGVVYIQRPGNLSFSYHKPNMNRVVSNGSLLKIYEHENKQMFVKKVAGTQYPGALAFIMGNGMRQNFKFKFHKTAKWEGGPVLIGKPRVKNPGYETVLFYIDDELLKKGDPACMRRVLVLDAQGNRNRFDFIRVEAPDKISPTEFIFEPPKGTEIIK